MAQILKQVNAHGELLLKKPRIIFVSVIVALFLSSCVTMPDFSKKVDPLKLFEPDASIYAQLKVQDNEELFKSMLTKNILEIDQNSIDIIMERSHAMYFAIYDKSSKYGVSTHVVVQGAFPSFYVNTMLNKRRGWNEKTAVVNGFEYEYKEHITGIQLAVLSSNYLVIATKNVSNVQYNYDNKIENNIQWPLIYDEYGYSTPVNTAFTNSNTFTMYIPKARTLLSSAFDIPLEIAADYAYGAVTKTQQDAYKIDIQLQVEESILVKGTMALLKLATRGTDLKLDLLDGDVIVVSNLPFDAFNFFNVK